MPKLMYDYFALQVLRQYHSVLKTSNHRDLKNRSRIMFGRLLFIAVATVLTTTSVQGVEPLAADTDIDAISSEFFRDLEAGKVSEAWQFAFKGSVVASDEGLARAITQTQSYITKMGKISNWSKLKSVKITETLERNVYYVELDAAPMFFELIFYNHHGSWKIVNVNMDTYSSAKTKGYFDDK